MSPHATLITNARVRPGQESAFWLWEARHSVAVARSPGFISSDVIPAPDNSPKPWTFLLNFESQQALAGWRESAARAALVAEVAALLEDGELKETIDGEGAGERPAAPVTEVIFSRVRPGMADRYREWATRIQAAQARYPGYQGSYVQAPASSQHGYWTTIIRYASPSHLQAWMSSPERADLLKESKDFIETEELMQLATAFPGWVPFDPLTGEPPPNWKAAALIVLPLFPIVMLELKFVLPALAPLHLNPALVTLLQNSFNVSTTGMITMPPLVSIFGWWLLPKGNKAKVTARGLAIILAIFALETVLMWRML